MKKILCLLLSLTLLGMCLTACQTGSEDEETEDKGAVIPVYLSTEICDFDPATAYTDESAMKILGMVYEGLYRINEKGKLEEALASGYKVIEDAEDGVFTLEIYLKNTAWSDGRSVQAADFVYAIKRVMEPEFRGEAASMLMDIKNAKAVKNGDMSIDDLGIYDADTQIIVIQFETSINYEQFLEYLASPLLYPVREDVVSKATDWSSNTSILVCNGPFVVRTFDPGKSLVLERNIYYYRDIEDDKLTKYVVPYRLAVNFGLSAEEQLAEFESGKLVFNGEIPLSKRASYAETVEIQDTLTEHAYFFNTTKAPLDKPEVRRALSLALDRKAIADKIVYAKPAEGVITGGVYEAGISGKTMFRDSGALLSESANMSEAKSLLSSAGVSGGDLTLTIRENEVDRAAAELAVAAWGELGFNVSIVALGSEKYEENEYDLFSDLYKNAYAAGDFDIIAVDMTMFSVNAFPNLASFALQFAGGSMDLASGNFDVVPGVTGFNNEEYNGIIDRAFAEKDITARAAILHEAEAKLLELAPIAPVFVYQDAFVVNEDLTGVKNSYYGYHYFAKAKLKNYELYQETTPIETAAVPQDA